MAPTSGVVLEHLQAQRSLAGDDEWVVERMHHDHARLCHQLVGAIEGLGRVLGLEVDLGAVGARGGDLLRAGALPHHDLARDPLQRGAVGDRLGMVPGRDADHAARLLLVRERGQLGEHAPGLEGAGALEELGLEQDVGAGDLAQLGGAEGRCVVQAVADRLARGQHLLESNLPQAGVPCADRS